MGSYTAGEGGETDEQSLGQLDTSIKYQMVLVTNKLSENAQNVSTTNDSGFIRNGEDNGY